MKNYNKIFKLAMWILIAISVVLLVIGFAGGWAEGNVDTLLTWTYIMVALAVAVVIIVGLLIGFKNDAKKLLKMLLILAALAVVCFIVYLIAPGTQPVGMLQQQSAGTLKLTDTMLYLSYFAGILAVLAIIFGEIRIALNNKK